MLKKILLLVVIILTGSVFCRAMESRTNRLTHEESAAVIKEASSHEIEIPPLPEGMTLDQVLASSAEPAPESFPITIRDNRIYCFVLFEQFEYRSDLTGDDNPSHLGWDAQGWIGNDYNKFWWKSEGISVFSGPDNGESETDLLYSRLVKPFWSIQAGVQYANEWNGSDYGDLWSGVIALQGLAPYKFELDNSLYISEKGDVRFAFEAEYDLRVTQRLVIQPRLEFGVSAQDIDEKRIGAGITDFNIDLRLRYEIKREFAPYAGFRYQSLLGETANIAEASGRDTDQTYLMAGLRFAF